MNLLADVYAHGLRSRLDSLEHVNRAGLDSAATIIQETVLGGGIVYAFGSGHSQASALEIAGRAGGLIPTNKIAISDLVIYGGEPASVLADPLLEREEGLAHRLLDLADIRAGDSMILFSNSGVNGAIVEMAKLVTSRGIPVIAITSLTHVGEVPSKHSSGQVLADVADVVLDNLAPVGDAIVPIDAETTICGVSSITAAYLVQILVALVADRMRAADTLPPFYRSANVLGGHEWNVGIENQYEGRLRRLAI